MANEHMSINDDISSYLQKVLSEYGQEVKETVSDVIKQVSKDTLKKVKQTSPKRRGVYAKGWSQRVTVGKFSIDGIIFGSKPSTYTIAHLLENGHLTRSGTRTRPYAHLKPALEEAQKEIIQKLGAML